MFNGGEFSKILDEIFEKDDKEKEKAIKIYCKIWKYLENITLQNLKYKRAFENLKYSIENAIEELKKEKTSMRGLGYKNGREAAYKGVLKLLEELMKGEKN